MSEYWRSMLHKPLEQGNGPGFTPEELAQELAEEICTQNNPEEVGERLAGAAYEVRKAAFETLLILTRKTSDPECVTRLLTGGRTKWTKIFYIIAEDLRERGEESLASRLYEEEFARTMQDPTDAHVLRSAGEVSLKFGKMENASRATHLLLSLARQNANILDECMSLASLAMRGGHAHVADMIWQTLREAWPDRSEVRRGHIRFMKERLRSPEDEDARKSPRQHGTSKMIAENPHPEEILQECERQITASLENHTLDFWINTARYVAEHRRDLLTANRLWSVILRSAPQHAYSFLNFSREFNTMGRSPEIDALIRHAHALTQEVKKTFNKGKRIVLKSTAISHTEALDAVVTIDATPQTCHQWLGQAGQRVSEKDCASACRIWSALLRHDRRLMPAVTRGLVRIASELPPEKVLAELRMEEMLEEVPDAANLYRSLAANLAESHPAMARDILSGLWGLRPEDPGTCLALAEMLLQRGQCEDAARIWLPLQPSHLPSCLRFASGLALQGNHALATMLYREVAGISPESLIRHGYSFYQNPAMRDAVRACVAPILPRGNEKTLGEHQFLALKLFLHHSTTTLPLHTTLSRLVGSGALSQKDAERVLATPSVFRARQPEELRDAEIEEYVARQMTDAQQERFFSGLSDPEKLLENMGEQKQERETHWISLPHPGQ